MIGFLPEIYPDELVYSFLARCYVRSGYINYTFFAENIYVKKILFLISNFLIHLQKNC